MGYDRSRQTAENGAARGLGGRRGALMLDHGPLNPTVPPRD